MHPQRNFFLSLCLINGVLLLLSGCAGTQNPRGEEYDEPVIPGQTRVLNLTGNLDTDGAAEVYFSASSRIEMLVTFRDRLVAVEVDGKLLPVADKGGQVTYSTGYQAIALSPGIHTVSYCHVTRSAIATGARICGLTVKDFNFEPNARYMVGESVNVTHSMTGSSTLQNLHVRTGITRVR